MRMSYLNVALCLWVASAFASTFASAEAFANTECRQGDLTRSINVVYSNPGQPVPCEVLYEKPDESLMQTLWRAHNEAGYCETRAAEFVEKLRSLGWQCTSAPSTDASSTDEARPDSTD